MTSTSIFFLIDCNGRNKMFAMAVMCLALFFSLNQRTFAQPEAAGAAILAIEERPTAGGAKAGGSGQQAYGKAGVSHNLDAGKSQRSTGKQAPASKAKTPEKQTATVAAKSSKDDGFIVGDKYTFLNFEIAEKVQPLWTLKAKNEGASGLVQVELLIDKNGNVLTAKARTGNPLLHPEAEKAALATKFNKPLLYNKPVKAMGFVVYRFGKAEDDD